MDLDKTSHGFRIGYRDGEANKPRRHADNGTFIGYDYTQGYDAALNTQYWDAQRANKSWDHFHGSAK